VRIHLLERSGARARSSCATRTPQVVVPHGTWFAAGADPGAAFALVGCVVAPGFESADFELAERERPARRVPRASELVMRFTRERTADRERAH
jgi:predicted cupin superfamily sugar epimerase